jgi:leucyl/phenylalanyl-tRNA--protein transferase
MANRESALIEITPEVLLKAYACGIFPMAESADDPALYWVEPEMRGVIPLDRFHMPARLARTVRADRFTVAIDRDFDGVLDGCAEPQPGRPPHLDQCAHTLYRKLCQRRHCHSVEVRRR